MGRPTPLHPRRPRRQPGCLRLLLLVIGGTVLGFLGLCLWIRIQGGREEIVRADAIVVLGAAQWAGRPSPVLQARLDRAVELYRQGYAPLLVLTGGTAPGDERSEAAVGRDYAIAHGVPEEAILTEDQSRTTVENLRGARDVLTPYGASTVLLVSDPFHMTRSIWIARDLGFTPHPAPTHSSPISEQPLKEARYVVREAFALILYGLLGQ